ncbi:MAG: acetyl-CoA carboxylase biotin carboxyl carrier protein subunit [Chloroflexi bacterium]|nr:MAG: acetyl-CoA carboxylase biotin carboxyl carrier protein subunit [Chloroflexota bacterium]
MKYVVKIAEKQYEVEIEDIHARPVIARVDGQEFRVTPENGIKPALQKEAEELNSVELSKPLSNPGAGTRELTAPLPGTIIEIFVKPGEQIEMGQVILIIEAMKMKNSIRSTRAGKILEVLVSAGQTVAHKQPLVRFG